jgi:hypothetical protein
MRKTMSDTHRRSNTTLRFALVLTLTLVCAGGARGSDGEPDPAYRDAQFLLRAAIRDTAGHGDDAARLDSLGQAYFRLARLNDAASVLRRAVVAQPRDHAALATLGRIALWQGRTAEADSLLAAAGDAEGAPEDRYAAAIRRGDWKTAAAQAEAVNDAGRSEVLQKLSNSEPYKLRDGRESGRVSFERAWPVPLVPVKVNGLSVLMAVDPGAPGLIVDPAVMRLQHLPPVPGESSVLWNGARTAVKHAWVPRFEIAGMALSDVPADVLPLRRYSLDVNPQGTTIGGVIGLAVLERFGVTIDFKQQVLELRRPGVAYAPQGQRVPFERWGESELMVYGSVNGSRRMALQLGTGLPGAALGSTASVFDELSLKPSRVGNLIKGAGTFLQGRSWDAVPVPTIALGSIVRDRANGWSGVMSQGELWRYGARRDGLLGAEMFRGRRVTFDWAKQAMVFEGD